MADFFFPEGVSAALAASAYGWQWRMAVKEQDYYVRAGVMGVSREVARANLLAVIQEHQQSPGTFDVFDVALQRLTETPITRPSEKVRDAVRQALLATSSRWNPPTPGVIDSYARWLSTRTDADDLAELQVPDCPDESADG